MGNSHHLEEIKKAIEKFPKVRLIHLPTPLQPLRNISKEMDGVNLFVKRDDLTGLAFGGNKSRKLEFIIRDALQRKADVIITWASLQSNWCLQTAVASRMFGLTPVLVLFKPPDVSADVDGNLLLDRLVKADIRVQEQETAGVMKMEDVEIVLYGVVREVKEWGHTPYIAPIGGSMVGGSMEKPLGAISYVQAFFEMTEQAEALGVQVQTVIHASGSGGTQAGLVVGAKAVGGHTRILGISVSEEKGAYREDVLRIARDTAGALELPVETEEEDVIVLDDYIGEGYGQVYPEITEVISWTAMKEGIFLDPVYTGKAMFGLKDLARKGTFSPGENVVFFHTGGTPAHVPFRNRLRFSPGE
ncbi:MAG: 1-aminocyclopropane-1-carboxylate deaminase/D-cysteine desulfhydrase [Candidatus Aminicenantales bacterium]